MTDEHLIKTAIITGGSGFVGSHLIGHLAEQKRYGRIINVDITGPQQPYLAKIHGRASGGSTDIVYLNMDVCRPLDPQPFRNLECGPETHIYNLAAICRIPGFPDIDYFRTNIQGAETTCRLAEELGCRTIIFTSSIAPYGASEELKTEESIPQPDNPYGSSKLVAEYIHRGWQQKDPEQRRLTIFRPGIIFGPGENANFTRLFRSMKSGYFFYPGRRDTKKACVYVKDVARACDRFAQHPPEEGTALYNLVYPEPPTIEEICNTITEHTGAGRARFTVPGPLLMGAAHGIRGLGKLTGRSFTGIHPDRVRKVMISTNISGKLLAKTEFTLQYTLAGGVNDWNRECGGELR